MIRLLHTKTLKFTEFPTSQLPGYAILSHRWLENEVSYSDMSRLTDDMKQTDGYQKIANCCKQASSVGLDYVWIDTCCINKQDKDELTYALNAMFTWYRKSQVCYCYMYDVPENDLDPEHVDSKFRKSEWFTRGWTLQELLAPLYVIFFNRHWEEIGTKSSLRGIIADITGIAQSIVVLNQAGKVSVAQRLSWAAKRFTSVGADKSYCLMGLLGVNMPMKLQTSDGKRVEEDEDKTFFRLQVQVLKTSDDQSLFCWQEPPGENRPFAGLLARSPQHFKNCRRFYEPSEKPRATRRLTFSSKGLRIRLPLIPDPERSRSEDDDVYLAFLACHWKPEINYEDGSPIAIYLKKLEDNDEGYPMYARIRTDTIKRKTSGLSFGEDDFQDICVREEPHWIEEAHTINAQLRGMSLAGASNRDPCQFELSSWMAPEPEYLFCFRSRPQGVPICIQPHENNIHQWTIPNHDDGELKLRIARSGHSAALLFRDGKGGQFYTIIGVHNYHVWSDLGCDLDKGTLYETMNWIAIEYEWPDGFKTKARWESRDRMKLKLPEGGWVNLGIRNGWKDGKKVYWIDIQTGDAFRLEAVSPCDEPWMSCHSSGQASGRGKLTASVAKLASRFGL